MSRPLILSVGQCGFDHGQISRKFGEEFRAEVVPASTHTEAFRLLRTGGPFQLVLVNRIFDANGAAGLDLIRDLKGDPELAGTKVMLVSNYPDAQDAAVEAGAERGFGKAELGAPSVRETLSAILGPNS